MASYATNRDDQTKLGGIDQGTITFFNNYSIREATRGGSARLTWGDSQQNLIVGMEYGHVQAKFLDLLSSDPPVYDKSWDSWGLYANGAYSIGALTILPGIRQDYTGISGNNLSYSLGATYQLSNNTVLRVYGAKGFSLPMVYLQNSLQKVTTIQGGIESGAVPYLWLKGTYFFNALRDSESLGPQATVTNQKRQGFELEVRTTPLYNLSLSSGYTFLYAKDADSGERLQTNSNQTVPPHTVKTALNYDNADFGLSGSLTGNYVRWNGAPGYPVADHGMIWDLHLSWKVRPTSDMSPELFFSGHNLFNGNQTVDTILYNSAPRWFEGGIKLNF